MYMAGASGHEVNSESGQGGLYNVVGTLLFPAQLTAILAFAVFPGFAGGIYYRNKILTHIKKILR